jgi:hypothetical protein
MTKHGTMMKCGCAAYCMMGDKYGCGTHDCWEPMEETLDLSNRVAMCSDCGNTAPSDPDKLAFFRHEPDRKHDSYYCGCRGWD